MRSLHPKRDPRKKIWEKRTVLNGEAGADADADADAVLQGDVVPISPVFAPTDFVCCAHDNIAPAFIAPAFIAPADFVPCAHDNTAPAPIAPADFAPIAPANFAPIAPANFAPADFAPTDFAPIAPADFAPIAPADFAPADLRQGNVVHANARDTRRSRAMHNASALCLRGTLSRTAVRVPSQVVWHANVGEDVDF